MDKLIFDAINSIYKDPSNKDEYGQVGIFQYSKSKLESMLPTEAIKHIESGKCPYGRFSTYGGSYGTYKAINPTSEFYQKAKNL